MIILLYVSAVRVGNFGCNLDIYILKEKLSNWNGCKKRSKITGGVLKCLREGERETQLAEFIYQN